jgi:hypothetical protein
MMCFSLQQPPALAPLSLQFSQLSLSTEGKHKYAVCMLLCEHINELFGSKNGGRFFD